MTGNRMVGRVQDDDSALIRAINDGGADRFTELVDRYEKKLYNFGLRVCGDPHDAEDLVQDTFLNVFRYLGSFRFETKFKNWLYRVAASVCMKKRRRSKYAPDRELSLEEFLPKEGEAVPEQVPDWATDPAKQVLNDELSRLLKDAILELPDKYRVVVILRDLEDFSTEESAQILGISPANVKVRLHRGRLFLRDKLQGYFHDGP